MWLKSFVKDKQNMKKHRNGGLVGASFNKNIKKWRSVIIINRKKKDLGHYESEQEAHEAYMAACLELK
jgi:hypothetical protein